MSKRLAGLIVRHGSTILNEDNAFRSRMDPELDKKGVAQAEKIGKLIASKYDVRTVIAGPLKRTVQTADIISEHCEAKVKQDRGLISWDLGFLSGRDKDEYGAILQYYVDHPKEKVPQGESLDDLEQRTLEFFERLKDDPQDEESGTPQSGYAEDGPYHCKDCIHKPSKESSYCNHPEIVADPRNAKRKVNGLIQINREHGCCRYVKPKKEDPGLTVYITHTSNIIALENLFHGNRDGRPESNEDSIEPGGLAEIWETDGEFDLKPVVGEKPAAFGE